ncbi:dual 3',5'-cyclic-AMP and-GMP phosphodiesterase [Thraustotheca clavata]|uniref:Dual 3',5'-cyclic-AMP and-GMP phosphodiesterase n=1 Tax=Thraustotheca clavata TaxID=74557 RepID=A0A1V9ZE78_9STRA|nr:dual 3',5'-cyclic-AMP and-GMP phosphodiesterase [Thraustotheca clavata]
MSTQTAEGGEEYLNSMNFRSLIEWLTAEALLSRPEDPLAFIRTIASEKLALRSSGENYNPEHAMAYIKQCYAEASASADENGRLCLRPKRDNLVTTSGENAANKRAALLEKLIQAFRIITMQLDPFEATNSIIKQTCKILNCERATLFKLDAARHVLNLSVAEGAAEISVPIGKGIAGIVASSGKLINIANAYADPNFDSQYDMQTGYHTRSILCVPVRNGNGNIVGVMQALNRVGNEKDGGFTDMDEEVMTILAAQAGIALQNAQNHKTALQAQKKVTEVLDIVKAMHSDLGINSLIFTVTHRIQTLIDSDRCSLYLLDKNKGELWTLQGEVDIRIPSNMGISGAVAEEGKVINLLNAYDDPRFNKEYDQKLGYKTQTILALPLRGKNHDVIGVLQLLNKTDGVFTSDDEEILGVFLSIAGPILENSSLFLKAKENTDENEMMGRKLQHKPAKAFDPEMNEIKEGEDDGEEE